MLDGNYLDEIASIVWPAADAVVWLDPPRHRAVRRAVLRTARRWAGRQHLWNGNREHWHNLTPASIRRLVDHWPDYPARIEQMAARLRPARTIRLRHDREVRFLLSQCHDRAVVVQ